MPEAISSRTPEGQPNRCPVCGGEVCIEPSAPHGDAPCPKCGVLLWFFRLSDDCYWYEASRVQSILERLAGFFRDKLGLAPSVPVDSLASVDDALAMLNKTLVSDSLDTVELVMVFESEFGAAFPAEDIAQIKTLGDAVKFLIDRDLD